MLGTLTSMSLRKTLIQAASSALRPAALLGAGSTAPEFDLQDHTNQRIRSEDLKEAFHYILVFYPGDDTPGCTLQLRAFSQLRDEFAAQDCKIFGVNPAGPDSHARFVDKCALSIPLLVDSDRSLAQAYQTARPGIPRTFRAVFLIDKRGIVRSAMKDMPEPSALLALVTRSNQTGYKGSGRRGRQKVPEVSSYGLRKVLSNEQEARVLDIREAVDWRAGHIPGALNIPIDELKERIHELPDPRRALIICCTQGLRASGAAHILDQAGWRNLYKLTDGMEAYRGELVRAEAESG
ncbi:MAG: hypothetical protein CMP23_01170 [Rickettsiales bacterium]|nr:hypothetical protein [Rickettsiales bacterium]|tara:strand:+ start:6481 stop:7362 length:882 start_codon:yes stop_codon:yes gene_type:complete